MSTSSDAAPERARAEPARGRLRVELACVGLVLVASWPLLAGRCHVDHDVLPYALPHLDALQRELAAGRLRTWEPALYCGYYAHGAGQAGSLYPPNLVLLGALPLLWAYKASILLHQWLLARGLAALAGALGASRRAQVLAAAAGLLSGSATDHVWHHNVVVALGWAPWCLLLAARVGRAEGPRAGPMTALLLAGAYGLALLQAHPQWHAYTAMGALAVAAAVAPPGRRLRAAGLAAAGLAGAGLLAAALLLPMWGYQQVWPRPLVGGRWAFLAGNGARLEDLAVWLLGGPSAPPQDVLRPGAVVWALAWLHLRALGRAGLVCASSAAAGLTRAGLALAALGLFFAPSELNPLYPLLVHVPPFSLFRVPSRILALAQLGLCLLAAGGLDRWARGRDVGLAREAALVLAGAAGAAALLRHLGGAPLGELGLALPALGIAVVALGAGGLAPAAGGAARARRVRLAAALALLLLEQASWYHRAVSTAPDAVVATPPPLAAPVVASSNPRVLDLAAHEGVHPLTLQRRLRRNGATRFGVEYLSGFESAVPLAQEVVMLELLRAPPEHLVARAGALSARWLVLDAALAHPDLRLAGVDAGAYLHEHVRARPRCYALHPGERVEPLALEALAPTHLRVAVDLRGPARVVVAQAWYPDWSVEVDGEPAEVALEGGLFVGVDLGPGRHEVVLRFEDPLLEQGLRLSAAAWVAWAALLALLVRRARLDDHPDPRAA